MKCAICGKPARGWNVAGPFCSDEHYQRSDEFEERYEKMHQDSLNARNLLHRIEALESELLRISAVVGEVDYELIQSLLADDLK